MDCVYICRSGPNEELKYSIRSAVQNLPIKNIWVVGNKPDWYCGNFIDVKDNDDKFNNIVTCYKAIITNNKISDDFILMNDDFFVLKPIKQIFHYYDGLLTDKIIDHISVSGNSKYARLLKEALKILKSKGINEPLNYDIHTPIIFNKNKLLPIINLSLAPRSMYGNIYNIGGLNVKDVKIYKNTTNINFDSFISTEDNSFKLIANELDLMFPNKTIYEKE